jgi:hypothetical protein
MGKFRSATVLLLLLLGGLTLSRPAGAAPEGRVTAWQLVRTVDSSLAGLAQTVEARGPETAAFWSTLNGLRVRILGVESALSRRDGEFFTLVDQGSTDLGALRVAWARTGLKNDQAARHLRAASVSYRLLRANYGREGVRLRRGGDLNEAEQRQFQRVRRAQRRFADSLLILRQQAQRRNDPVTVAELDRFRGEAERIAAAPSDLESYLNSLIVSGETRGEWEADAPYIQQDAPEDFAVANEMVEDLYVESDIGHVFTVDLGAPDALAHLDQETAVPAAAADAGAVQILQPAEGGEVEDPVAAETVPILDAGSAPALADGPEDTESPAKEEVVEEEDLAVEAAEDVQAEDGGITETEAAPTSPEIEKKAEPVPADPKNAKQEEAKKDGAKKPAPPADPKPPSPPAKSHPKHPAIG